MKAFERTFASQFGVPNATRAMNFAGRTDTSLVREGFQRHRIEASSENFRHFFDAYVFWLHHLLGELRGEVCPGAHELIESLRQLPEPPVIGLLTGNIRLGAEIKLRHFGLWDCFETGAFGDDHENRNELAAIAHRRGAKKLGPVLRREEVLVVGDTPLDIECGCSIQARVLAVATGGYSGAELRKHPATWVVETLTEVDAAKLWRDASRGG